MPSTPTVTVTYLFDPLCGWCYAAAPVLARLQATPGVQVLQDLLERVRSHDLVPFNNLL